MLLDLKFSVGTLGLAMGTFLAGLYGMNLENFIEETNWGFGAVTSMSTFASILVCWYGLIKLRKVQRIKMMPRSPPPGTGNGWRWEDRGMWGTRPPTALHQAAEFVGFARGEDDDALGIFDQGG